MADASGVVVKKTTEVKKTSGVAGETAAGDSWLVNPSSKELADTGKVAKGAHAKDSDDELKKKILSWVGVGLTGALVIFGATKLAQSRDDDLETVKYKGREAKGQLKHAARDAKGNLIEKADETKSWFGRGAHEASENLKDAGGAVKHTAADAAHGVQHATGKVADKVTGAAKETAVWVEHKGAKAAEAVAGSAEKTAEKGRESAKHTKDDARHAKDKAWATEKKEEAKSGGCTIM